MVVKCPNCGFEFKPNYFTYDVVLDCNDDNKTKEGFTCMNCYNSFTRLLSEDKYEIQIDTKI